MLNYGMKEQKLANNLGISVEKAAELMQKYMSKWTAVRRFFDDTQKFLHQRGSTYTFGGRRRYLPGIRSSNPYESFRAGRQGANAIIQGTAAEIAKAAMIRLVTEKALSNLGWRLLLQIHDEVICEGPEETVAEAKAVVKDAMEDPFRPWGVTFGAPLQGTPTSGPSWWACK